MIIAICGFMGAGKSAFLKQYPETNSIDLDSLMEDSVGPLGEYIRVNGWDTFRELESKTMNSAIEKLDGEGLLALGGGALDREENIELLKSLKVRLLFLDLDFESCLERIKGDKNRPQLDKSEEELKELFMKREELFKSQSHFTLKGDSQFWPTQWTLLKTLM